MSIKAFGVWISGCRQTGRCRLIRVRIGEAEEALSWEAFEERVRSGRIPDDALVAADAVTGGAFVRAADLEFVTSLRNDAAIAYEARFSAAFPPVVTALLVGVQIRIWWFAQIDEIRTLLIGFGTSFTPALFDDGQVWRFLTMGLLHTDVLHIVLNMMWLAYCGYNLERAIGRANLVVLYFTAVAVGSLASALGSPWSMSLGASGGVFGLVAASVVFGLGRPDLLPPATRRWFGAAMLPYLLIMFWSGLDSVGTDNWAHFGGLVTGLLLGLLMDPDEMPRRKGFPQQVRIGALALVAGLGLAVAAFGPRLHPLADSEAARWASRPDNKRTATRPTDRATSSPLTFSVPSGWRPGVDAVRSPAFVMASFWPGRDDNPRAFGVRMQEGERIVPVSDLAQSWVDKVRKAHPDAEVGPLIPLSGASPANTGSVTLAGLPATQLQVTLDGHTALTWTAAVQGVRTIEAVFQSESSGRLAALHRRLLSEVALAPPADLVAAQAEADARPHAISALEALALALARSGDGEAALALHEVLVADGNRDRWLAMLKTVRVLGTAVPDVDRLLEQALAASQDPEIVVSVAEALEGLGRLDEARGLMRIAWGRSPGDVHLKRGLRRLDMPTALDADTALPWALARDPTTGALRPPAERAARLALPLTLEGARAAGKSWAADRQAALEAALAGIAASDIGALAPLLFLKHGYLADEGDARAALLDDLETARGGPRPPWLPEPVSNALADNPAFLTAVRRER